MPSDLKVDIKDSGKLIRVDPDSDNETSKQSKPKLPKPMNAKQREQRIASHERFIAEINFSIEAMERHTKNICQEFVNDRMTRLQFLENISLSEGAITGCRNQRKSVQSALDKLMSS